MPEPTVSLFLCGDVMLGRGIDQVLAHPGDPALQERVMTDARGYVRLAESVNGPIPVPVDDAWPWGYTLALLAAEAPDVRIVNLETAITSGGDFEPGKGIHYRMTPLNAGCLAASHPDAVVLANNHVLDFGPAGLIDTLNEMSSRRMVAVGAGVDDDAAWRPAAVPTPSGRILVLAAATGTSGVPDSWAAAARRPGVAYLPVLDGRAATRVAAHLNAVRRPADAAIVSIHWGSNWGYTIEPDEADFAHRLIDAGVDLVHGHSSHHPRPIEIYRNKLILYGCGDLINDYEGIGGYASYRPDLRVAYLVTLDARTGDLVRMRMVGMRARKMSLERAPVADARWLQAVLARRSHGCVLRLNAQGEIVVVSEAGRT